MANVTANTEEPIITPEIVEPLVGETTEIEKIPSEIEVNTPPVETATKTDLKDPLHCLSLIKTEVENFVKAHNQKIKNYEDQIKALQKQIQEEKDLLKTKKKEFRSMLEEIHNLTDFSEKVEKPAHQKNQSNHKKTIHKINKPRTAEGLKKTPNSHPQNKNKEVKPGIKSKE